MNLEQLAERHVEQVWDNLPINLEVLTDDEAAMLRDRLSELLQEVNYRG